MKIGVPRETHPGERRVATTPEVAVQLQKLGYEVVVEKDAGAAASFSDEAYEGAGCTIAGSAASAHLYPPLKKTSTGTPTPRSARRRATIA